MKHKNNENQAQENSAKVARVGDNEDCYTSDSTDSQDCEEVSRSQKQNAMRSMIREKSSIVNGVRESLQTCTQ